MRTKVLEFLTELPDLPEEQFNKASELYRKTPHKNPSSERFYNSAGFTKINLENLLYDLKQLHAISDTEVVAHNAKKQAKNAIPELVYDEITNTSVVDIKIFLESKGVEVPQIPAFSKGAPGTKERKTFAASNKIVSSSNKKQDFEKAFKAWHDATIVQAAEAFLAPEENTSKDGDTTNLEDSKDVIEITATDKEEVFTTAPDDVKETVKLRDVYPFLNDTDCPEELYILVGKKFAHYNAYVAAHKALLVIVDPEAEDKSLIPMTDEEIFELAKAAVENFEADELITKEMDHYKETGKILGEHPIFKERKLKAKVDEMTNAKAITRKTNLENYIRKNEKLIKTVKTEAQKEKLANKINDWQVELNLLKAKLGFSEE